MSRRKKIVIGVVAILGLLIVGKVMGNRGPKETEVRSETVGRHDLVSSVVASGNIEAKTQVDVQSEVQARILKIHVREGDMVQRGQLLVELDQTQFRGSVERAEAGLASSNASLMTARNNRDQAKRNLDRMLELRRTASGAVTDEQVELAQQSFANAEATLESAGAGNLQAVASLNEARDNLARTRLYAPISGRVVRLAVEEGEVAVPGTFSRDVGLLMRIADLSVIQAKVKVDETDVVRLSLNDSVSVEIDAFPDTAFAGKVTRIANSAATTSATGQSSDRAIDFEVEVTIDNPPADVRPDLSMTASIITSVRKNALSIPIISLTARPPLSSGDSAQAVPLTGGSNTKPKDRLGVFVIQNGIARFREVSIGITGEEHFELLSGVAEGDSIVAGPYQAIRDLSDSTRVKILPAMGSMTPAAGVRQ